MIKSWRHKGLKNFFMTGCLSGVNPQHVRRLTIILQFLDNAERPTDMNLPGMQFHSLGGNMKDYFSVSVNGNWRIIFKFEDQDVILVDYLDYH